MDRRRWGWRGVGTRTRVAAAGLVVLVSGGAAVGVARAAADESGQATTMTTTATVGEVTRTVSATGTLEPTRQETVSFGTAGTVTDVLVDLGDRVSRGDAIARVTDDVASAQLTAARSAVDAALDELAAADGDSVAESAARSELVTSRDDLTAAREAVAATTLRAPFAGQVVTLDVEVGDVVGSTAAAEEATGTTTESTTTTAGTVEVASTRQFVVETTVGSSDLDSIEEGLQAEVTVTGVDDPLYATVSETSTVAETSSSGAAAFPVTLTVTGRHADLFGGTSVSAEITVEKRQDVLSVSSRALASDEDGTYVLLVGADGGTTRQPVEVGETYGEVTEITDGLAEGDEIELASPVRGAGGGGMPTGELPELPAGGFPEGGLPGAPQ